MSSRADLSYVRHQSYKVGCDQVPKASSTLGVEWDLDDYTLAQVHYQMNEAHYPSIRCIVSVLRSVSPTIAAVASLMCR
jgi:hypothetical protein